MQDIEAGIVNSAPTSTLKASHYAACYEDGMSEAEIEADWYIVEEQLAEFYEQSIKQHEYGE